jgi:hypothetical protein
LGALRVIRGKEGKVRIISKFILTLQAQSQPVIQHKKSKRG